MPTREEAYQAAKGEVRAKKYGRPNKYTKWYFGNNTACSWCGIFMAWVIKAKLKAPELLKGLNNPAYVPSIEMWGVANKKATTKPKLMDLVIFDWSPSNGQINRDHVGFFVKDNGDGTITTIEGNTSSTSNGDGDCVQIRKRAKKWVYRYISLAYAAEEKYPKIRTLTRLNLREEPNLVSNSILLVPKDAVLQTYEDMTKNGWIKVKYEGNFGYVRFQSQNGVYCEMA